jgi:metal transporter CNNM
MFLSLLAIGICLTLSAIFSGLTLGLMSLDLMGLQIVIESGTRKEASEQERKDGQLAQKILPFRKRGNLLLCTLLLGNVAVNCILSILMADLTSGLAGFLISTLSIVIFGEIVPQSVCSRHPLYIGSSLIPIVYIFVIFTFILSYPMSLLLDAALGEDMGTVYNRNQIKGMLSMYSKMKETDMGHEETTTMAGVVDFQAKQVGDCMTAIQDVFMIDIDDHLNFDLILRIFQSGHSRIPVYQMNPNHANSFHPKEVIGLLFAKELVLVDPEDCLPVRTICHHWFGRDVPIFYSDSKLTTVMNEFKSGRSHMALVKEVVDNTDGDPFYSTVAPPTNT